MKLSKTIALVTGGARGLGRAIALRLARDGADVVLAAPEQDDLQRSAAEVAALGRRSLPIVMDVTREEQVAAAVTQSLAQFGRIDLLVNNSGIAGPTALATNVTRAEWDETLAVNLTGAFLCAKAVLPAMMERRAGKIINISSIAGRIGYALRSPYAVSKWGLIGLTLTLAKEVGPYNIQVNAICPGPVQGDRMRAVIEHRAAELGRSVAEVEQDYLNTAALRRMVTTDDVAAMAAFLASAEADNMTGQALEVSAGYQL